MTDWDSIVMHLKATPGEELLVASGVGTSRCRPLLGKGLTIRSVRTSGRGTTPVTFDIYAMSEPEPDAAPYRIMTLVELCTSSPHEDRKDSEAVKRGAGWLEANPGRWFIVGESSRDLHSGYEAAVGMDLRTARAAGFEAEQLNNKIYARMADSDGLPLSDFVVRSYQRQSEPLPTLASDPFGWSLAELRSAVATARDWLLQEDYCVAA